MHLPGSNLPNGTFGRLYSWLSQFYTVRLKVKIVRRKWFLGCWGVFWEGTLHVSLSCFWIFRAYGLRSTQHRVIWYNFPEQPYDPSPSSLSIHLLQIQTSKTQEMNLIRDQVAALGVELQQRQSEKEALMAQKDDLNTQLQVGQHVSTHEHCWATVPKLVLAWPKWLLCINGWWGGEGSISQHIVFLPQCHVPWAQHVKGPVSKHFPLMEPGATKRLPSVWQEPCFIAHFLHYFPPSHVWSLYWSPTPPLYLVFHSFSSLLIATCLIPVAFWVYLQDYLCAFILHILIWNLDEFFCVQELSSLFNYWFWKGGLKYSWRECYFVSKDFAPIGKVIPFPFCPCLWAQRGVLSTWHVCSTWVLEALACIVSIILLQQPCNVGQVS